MIKALFFDIDDTILDYDKCEVIRLYFLFKEALVTCIKAFVTLLYKLVKKSYSKSK